MGEEVINKEESKVETEPKKEESPAPAEEDKKKEEEPPADAPPSPPPPVILGVEVHCTGCAKRIRRSLLRCKGVEAVHVDMAANQITVKGVAVDPDALCQRLRTKTKRDATVISPLPPPPAPADEAAAAPPPPPAEDPVRAVELLVNMHCDACAEQLQRKMLKMKGVQTAETDFAAGKLTVTGTVEGEKIVEYIHRRTGKMATVVPPPEPPKEEAAPPAEAEQKPADDGDGGKKEEDEKKPEAEAEQAAGEEKTEAAAAGDEKPGKQEGDGVAMAVDGFPPEEMMKRMVYWPYGGAHYSHKLQPADAEEAMMARRMAMYAMPPPPPHPHHHPYAMMHQHHQWVPPPPPPPPAPMYYGSSYMMERPPQMFSDENPNACVIS